MCKKAAEAGGFMEAINRTGLNTAVTHTPEPHTHRSEREALHVEKMNTSERKPTKGEQLIC